MLFCSKKFSGGWWVGGWWWYGVIIESISRSRPETRECLWVSVDLEVFWSWPGHGLDPELDNYLLNFAKKQYFLKLLFLHDLIHLSMNCSYSSMTDFSQFLPWGKSSNFHFSQWKPLFDISNIWCLHLYPNVQKYKLFHWQCKTNKFFEYFIRIFFFYTFPPKLLFDL